MSFRRWLAVVALFLAAAFCGILAGLLHFAGSGLDRTMEIAARAPTRSLAEVMTTDGTAWVKVRLEVSSGTVPLTCAGQSCLLVEVEEFQTRLEDIRSGGTWTRRPFERSIRSERKVVSFDLVDGPTRLTIRDALGVKFWPDLLQERHSTVEETGGLGPAAGPVPVGRPGSGPGAGHGPVPGQGQAVEDGEGSGAAVGMGGRRVESFLPDGTEAWALGSFRSGTPHVLDSGMFVLTSLGPERFGKTVHAGLSRVGAVQGWCAAGAVLFPLLALVLILKRR
ncbi:MAG: hypothetical protein GX442_23350 [Candidatus Riflebacteria bacterium]|nr:hypothetical protein [Candidatus Riflebacteria bacterium]